MGQKGSHKSGYEWVEYFGMTSPPLSLTKEEAITLWDEADEKKLEYLERVKDELKLEKMFAKISVRFLEQFLNANQQALEAAKTKYVTSNKSRELKKFERTVERAKMTISKEFVSPSSIAHLLRAAKVSPSGKIFKNKFIVTLVEGGHLEAKGMKWANFNKYDGPDPRISTVPKPESKESKGETKQRVLSPEEQLRRSKFQMAFKPEAKKLTSDAVIQARLKGFNEHKLGTGDSASRSTLPEPSMLERRGSKSKSELSHISQSHEKENLLHDASDPIKEEEE
jgi:hypothetical protein